MTQATPMSPLTQLTQIPAIARLSEAVQTQWERVQPRIRRIGGITALVQGAILLTMMFVNATVFQNAHFKTGANLTDPKVYLPVVAAQPFGFILSNALFAVLGITIGLVTLAFFDLLGPAQRSLSLPATAAGLLAGLLFLVYGLFGMIRLPLLASDYAHHPAAHYPAFGTYLAITSALLSASVVVLGVWFIAASWAAVRAKTLGRTVTYIGLGWGVLALLSPIEDVSLYAIGQELLWPIWAFWIGFVLLRPARPAVARASERSSEPVEGQEA